MISLKTSLAIVVTILLSVCAYFIAANFSNQSFSIFLPSIFVLLTTLILWALSISIGTVNPQAERSSSTNKPANTSPQASPQNNNSSSDQETGTLYVGNIAYKANEKTVQEHFEKVAKVNSVRLVKDKKSGRRKGFGFVEVDPSSVDKFIKALNDTEFMERNIIVRPANEKQH